MSLRPKDPLLAAARVVLMIAMATMAVACAAMVIAVPAIIVFKTAVLAELSSKAVPGEALWALVLILLLAALCTALGFLFFRHMYRIVGTVADGDPFIPANASRLSAMGWIVVAVNVAGIPLVSTLRWLESVSEHMHTEAGNDVDGLLLALVLFILARVFREGTRLRDEVEGTV
ncbi:DUF2975 domain-containing protein [Novosphingobium piscinae]|uniref:DUF2975 domain-containing protein n=1 Tax=Novosphingobium piscinae TaxID=1507448 RepID=A0A7X1KQZ1_9SPHN|nr:DUF2975 domain-containing protein [Novosphingobium piscinae]MBC2670226.1 DUF2975 domain-containing protein [Novosphingobium piscinae]